MIHFTNLLMRTEEASESTIEPIVTEYSDVTIPVLTMVLIGVGAVILIAAAIAAFIVIKNRGRNWGYAIFVGLASYLLFNYLLYSLLMFGLQKIPGVLDYFEAHQTLAGSIGMVMAFGLEFASIFFGLKYVYKTYEKRNAAIDLASVLMFGLAFYVAALLISRQLSYSVEYIMFSSMINKMGFDPSVTSMVQNGADQQEAIDSILMIAKQNSWGFLFDDIFYITRGITETCVAVLLFGVMEQRLPKMHILTAACVLLLAYVPSILGIIFNDGIVFVRFAVCLVCTAAAVFVTWKLLSKFMNDVLNQLQTVRTTSSRKKAQEPKKMPKINMPKD